MDPASVRRLLLVKLSSLGDVVHALPLLEALRIGLGDGVEIAWAIRERFAPLLEGNTHLTYAYLLRKPGLGGAIRFGRELAAKPGGRFDVALDAQGLLVSGLITRLSGASARIGLDRNREGNHIFLTHAVVPGSGRRHIVEILMGFCDALGIPRRAPSIPRYLVAGQAARAAELLAAGGSSDSTPVAGFIVGASTADKAWPVERWGELAQRLTRQGTRVALLGGAGEAERAARIVADAPGAVAWNLIGQTPLPVLASVLARCAVVVGGDSGPTHLAVAVGAPVVGLYGVTDPARTGPCWGPGPAKVLDYAEADAPPAERRPRHSTLTDALARIPAADVATAALEMLDAGAAPKNLT